MRGRTGRRIRSRRARSAPFGIAGDREPWRPSRDRWIVSAKSVSTVEKLPNRSGLPLCAQNRTPSPAWSRRVARERLNIESTDVPGRAKPTHFLARTRRSSRIVRRRACSQTSVVVRVSPRTVSTSLHLSRMSPVWISPFGAGARPEPARRCPVKYTGTEVAVSGSGPVISW